MLNSCLNGIFNTQRMLNYIALLVLIFVLSNINAQNDEKLMHRVGDDRYVEFKFQNDFFFKTDYYYSNGLVFNFIFPDFEKSPISKILIPVKARSLDYYGVKLVQEIYTPINTGNPNVIFSDRPYCSILYLGHKRTSFILETRSKISNEIIIGLIGRYSFGYNIQAYFHEQINNSIPAGWNNQVANDLILNYNFSVEKELFRNRFSEITGKVKLRAGTLYDDASIGFKTRFGYFNPNYSDFGQIKTDKKDGLGLKKFQIYTYVNPSIRAVFYNATLQGGFINQSSPFTMSYKSIEPIVLEINSAFVIQYSTFQLNIESHVLTPEFVGGRKHKWLSVGLRFNF